MSNEHAARRNRRSNRQASARFEKRSPGKRTRSQQLPAAAGSRTIGNDEFPSDERREYIHLALRSAAEAAARARVPPMLAGDRPKVLVRGAQEAEAHLRGASAGLNATTLEPSPGIVQYALVACRALADEPALDANAAARLRSMIAELTDRLAGLGWAADGPIGPDRDVDLLDEDDRDDLLEHALSAARYELALAGGMRPDATALLVAAAARRTNEDLVYVANLLDARTPEERLEWRAQIEDISLAIGALDAGLRSGERPWDVAVVQLFRTETALRHKVGLGQVERQLFPPGSQSTAPLEHEPSAQPAEAPAHLPTAQAGAATASRARRPAAGPASPVQTAHVYDRNINLATVVGRPAAPQAVRIVVDGDADIGPEGQFDPAQVPLGFEAQLEGDDRSRAAFQVGLREGLLFPSAATGGATSVPITFTPVGPGDYQADLRVIVFERGGPGAAREHHVALRGRALPADILPAGTSNLDPAAGPVVVPMDGAEHAAHARDPRQALRAAADSLSSLGAVYQAQVPAMKSLARQHLANIGVAAARMQRDLATWQAAEAAVKLEGLRGDAAGELVEFMAGAGITAGEAADDSARAAAAARRALAIGKDGAKAAAAAGGPEAMLVAVAMDVFFSGLEVDGASSQNRQIDRMLEDNELVGSFIASASSAATSQAIARAANLSAWFGGAYERLTVTAGERTSDAIHLVGIALRGDFPAEDALTRASRTVEDFRGQLEELAIGLRTIAGASIRADAAAGAALAALRDEFLRYRAGGGAPAASARGPRAQSTRVSLRGNLNLAGAPRLWLSDVRFGTYAPATPQMIEHAGNKNLLSLRGWDVNVELSLDDGSQVTLRQDAGGTRSVSGASDSAARARTAWTLLDSAPLRQYWVP